MKVLGDYVLLGELGRGSSSIVYHARHVRLNRPVALKLLETRVDGTHRDRFSREAAAAAALDHPGVVSVYEVAEWDGRLLLAMKLIPGGTLAERLNDGPFSPRDAAQLTATLARIIQHAHERGVLHRDIKPGNVLLDEDGRPHLADFGIAKLLGDDSDATATLAVLGTPAYMPPEIARGGAKLATTAADIYGLGAVLFHLLSGRPPFFGANSTEVLVKAAGDDRPRLDQATRDQSLPADLVLITTKAMDPDPSRRYKSASVLAHDLDNWLAGRAVSVRKPTVGETTLRWAQRHKVVATLSLMLALAVFIGGVTSILGWRRATRESRSNFELAHRLTQVNEDLNRRLISEELRRINDLFMEAEGRAGLALTADAVRRHPTNSVVAARLAFALSQPEFFYPVLASQHAGAANCVSFSADGAWLASGGDDGRLCLVRTAPPAGRREWNLGRPIVAVAWSPGRRACAALTEGSKLIFADAEGSLLEAPVPVRINRDLLRDLPGQPPMGWVKESIFYCVDHEAGFRYFDPTTAQLTEAPQGWPVGASQLCLSPDARVVLGMTPERGLAGFAAVDGGLVARAPILTNGISAGFSSDGKLALAYSDGEAIVWQVHTGQVQGRRFQVSEPIANAYLAPNGRHVVITTGSGRVMLRDVDSGTELDSRVLRGLHSPIARIRADGRAYAAIRTANCQVLSIPEADVFAQSLQHDQFIQDATWSPDNRSLAVASGDGAVIIWREARVDPRAVPTWQPRYASSRTNTTLARFDQHGRRLAAIAEDRHLTLVSLAAGTIEEKVLPLSFVPKDLTYVCDGRRLAVVGSAEHAAVFLTDEPATPALHLPVGQPALTVAADSAGALCAIGTTAGVVVFEMSRETPREVARLSCPKLRQVAMDPTGTTLATASEETGASRIWDARTGQALTPPLEHEAWVMWVTFSPDGRLVATGSLDHSARIWDSRTGRPLTPPLRHGDVVAGIQFMQDSKRLLTVSADGTARLWQADTGLPLGEPMSHPDVARRASASADGHWVVTCRDSGWGRLWSTATGQPISANFRIGSNGGVLFSPSDPSFATWSRSAGLQLWSVPVPNREERKSLLEAADRLSGRRRNASGAWEKVPPPPL